MDETPSKITIAGCDVWFPVGISPFGPQKSFISSAVSAMTKKENALLESPTGTGKTLSLLSSVLSYTTRKREENALAWIASVRERDTGSVPSAPEPPPRVYFASRTHSQLAQVVKELKRLRAYMEPNGQANRDVAMKIAAALKAPMPGGEVGRSRADFGADADLGATVSRKPISLAYEYAPQTSGVIDPGAVRPQPQGSRPAAGVTLRLAGRGKAQSSAPVPSSGPGEEADAEESDVVRVKLGELRRRLLQPLTDSDTVSLIVGELLPPPRSVVLASRAHMCVNDRVMASTVQQQTLAEFVQSKAGGFGGGSKGGRGFSAGPPAGRPFGKGGRGKAGRNDEDEDDDMHGVRVSGARNLPPELPASEDASLQFLTDGQRAPADGQVLRRFRTGLGNGSVDADCQTLHKGDRGAYTACPHAGLADGLARAMPPAWSIEDLFTASRSGKQFESDAPAAAGRKRRGAEGGAGPGGCPYYASHALFKASPGPQIVMLPYVYLLDPVLRQAMEVDLTGAIGE